MSDIRPARQRVHRAADREPRRVERAQRASPSDPHASATSCSRRCPVLSLAKAAKDYYLQKLGEMSPREAYYLRGGTASGRWRGSGSAALGLDGAVSAGRV